MCLFAEFDTEWDCDCGGFVCGGSIVLYRIFSDKGGCCSVPTAEESSKQINKCLQYIINVAMMALDIIMACSTAADPPGSHLHACELLAVSLDQCWQATRVCTSLTQEVQT